LNEEARRMKVCANSRKIQQGSSRVYARMWKSQGHKASQLLALLDCVVAALGGGGIMVVSQFSFGEIIWDTAPPAPPPPPQQQQQQQQQARSSTSLVVVHNVSPHMLLPWCCHWKSFLTGIG
jgi:hypothetical protein